VDREAEMRQVRVSGDVSHRVAWDVPVRLVAVASDVAGAPRATDRVVQRVAATLPGIAALDITTVRVGDLRLIEFVEPVLADDPRAAKAAGGLADLLADLRAGGRTDGADPGADAADASVPVLVAGTPFARSVLAALVRVPSGTVCTYAELATAAGRPRAVRAVATVMARNHLPVVLPCHRVVPSSGGVGRYVWGTQVKAALIAAESAVTEPLAVGLRGATVGAAI
jgi:O-6-methylguanine DNA methyltransferase